MYNKHHTLITTSQHIILRDFNTQYGYNTEDLLSTLPSTLIITCAQVHGLFSVAILEFIVAEEGYMAKYTIKQLDGWAGVPFYSRAFPFFALLELRKMSTARFFNNSFE